MLLPTKDLQRCLRDNMTHEEYTHNDMYQIYSEILRRDGMIERYSTMSQESFDKRLTEWSGVYQGWIVKKGRGRDAIYYKRYIHRCGLSKQALRDRVISKLRSIVSWRK